jgi:dihydrodipicolinate synthase/N-acetylneuraminate lyase
MESISETIHFTNEAAEIGADVALILTPSYFASNMNHAALTTYFTKVADEIKIPLLIYNVTTAEAISYPNRFQNLLMLTFYLRQQQL